jgi:hypothetical protein
MEYFGRINIDVNAATTYGTILKAPKITFAEAMERY